jgi:hypothetical protein
MKVAGAQRVNGVASPTDSCFPLQRRENPQQ